MNFLPFVKFNSLLHELVTGQVINVELLTTIGKDLLLLILVGGTLKSFFIKNRKNGRFPQFEN